MKKIYRAITLLIVSACFFHCQKDLNYIGDPDPVIPEIPTIVTPDPITANLQGNILDENNQPASGVNITVGSKTAVTDAKGYFRILSAGLDKNTSLVTAEKTGYFKGMRVFAATSGSNQVVIKLIKKILAGTVNASSGGDASLANGSKITLPANGIVMASSGAAYTGDIKVYASYIDPTSADIASTVPSSFTADQKNGNRVTLASFGMLAVELESAAGEKLQIKSDAEATLTTKISASRASSAPATIALWSVDEQTGLWKEEGTATKQGDMYVGSVKHFSFWNCDQPMNAVSLSLTLKNSDSIPLVYTAVRITRSGTGAQTSAYGYTDTLGQVKGLVPANEALLVEVLGPCGNAILSSNVQPLTQNTDLGTLYTSATATSLITLNGKLLDCNGGIVTNGYAIIVFDNIVRYAATDANGGFVTTFSTCTGSPTTCEVIGVDNGNQKQGTVTTVAITAPLTYTGNIVACGTSAAQFINYTLDGTNYSITSTANDSMVAFVNQDSTNKYVAIMGNQNAVFTNYINFRLNNATAPGTYAVSNFGVNNYSNIVLMSPFNAPLTTFAATVGDFFEGTLSGQFSAGAPAVVHTINATFRVRRNW